MKTEKYRLSSAYTKSAILTLERAGAVRMNLYTDASFSDPPVTEPDLAAAEAAMRTAQAAQAQGGTAATAEKDYRRTILTGLLEKLALYVQLVSGNDPVKLLSSGFNLVNANRTSSQLPRPTGLRLVNGLTGQLLLTVDRVGNARCYEIGVALLDDDGKPSPWTSGGLATKSRNMPVDGLVPGKMYAVQTRAVGGTTGYSDWSDPVVRRAI